MKNPKKSKFVLPSIESCRNKRKGYFSYNSTLCYYHIDKDDDVNFDNSNYYQNSQK